MAGERYPELLKLKGKIIAEGYSQKKVAEKIGISYGAFRNKIKGKTAFTLDEIYDLVELLDIEKDEIITYFFDELMRNAV